MIHSICKRVHFSAAHRLLKHPGQCHNLHGHNYQLDVCVKYSEYEQKPDCPGFRSQLDSFDMIIDFALLKNIIESSVIEIYDHKTILNSSDPLFDILDKEGIEVLGTIDSDPTVEVLASQIMALLIMKIKTDDSDVSIVSVRLWETETCYAEVKNG